MITVEEYDALVQRLHVPIRAEHVDASWARLRPENIVAHEAVVEAVEDLVHSGRRIFTVREVQEAMDPRFFGDRRRYAGPCWSTVDSGLRKMTNAGFLRVKTAGRPGRNHPRVYEATVTQ